MSAAAPPPTPTGIIPRFFRMIEAMKQGLGVSLDRRRMIGGPQDPLLLPITEWLWHYLVGTRRRLMALHARFIAGKLPAAPRRRAASRPAADRPASERPPQGGPVLRIPRGAVLGPYGLGGYVGELRELLDDPEMRALLAASPQAGRLLRPLWRKLTTEKLPEVLHLPPRPRRAKPARVARPESPGGNPSPRPVVCSSQPKPLKRGEGETGRAAWRYPVSLWSDPPAAKPAGRSRRCPPGRRRFLRPDAGPALARP